MRNSNFWKLIKFPIHFFYSGERFLNAGVKRLLPYYQEQTVPTSSASTKPVLICMFDGKMPHGGLADRLQGMVSIFMYAKEHGMDFRIHHAYPFLLSSYLMPNHHDWQIEERDICYNRSISKPIWVAFSDNLFEKTFCLRYLRKQLKGHQQYHIYPSLKIADKCFSRLYNELFKPSVLLEQELDKTLKAIGGKYITMSFRFVELLGDFKDCLHTTLQPKEREELINCCLTAIPVVAKKATPHKKIVITSDSVTFLERVATLPNIFIISGDIGHIDYQEDEKIHLKTFLDFYVIAHAEEVYMMRTEIMYRSGYARCAAMIYDKPFKEFVIK